MSITSNSVERRVGEVKKCNEAIELISLYIDDLLDVDSKIKLEEHLKTCKSCKQELDEMKTMVDLYKDFEEVELPVDFKEQLHQKLLVECSREANATKSFALRHRRLIRFCSSVAAIAIVAFAARGFFGDFTSLKTGRRANDIAENQMIAGNKDELDKQTESFSGTSAQDKNSTLDIIPEANLNSKSIQKSTDAELPIRGTAALRSQTMAMFALAEVPSNRTEIVIMVSEPEAELEKLDLCAKELGASQVPKGLGGEYLMEPDNNGQTSDENKVNSIRAEYKVINTEFNKVMGSLSEKFPTLNITKSVEIDSINKRIAEIEENINEIDSQITSLDVAFTEGSEKHKELLNAKARMSAERERLSQEYEYIIISVELIKSE